ncbi:hypothetical protein [Sphingomonas sp.]|uniref:hypothetical protein n=1 Tax=Sphingomonas sp. TaxID=28214 RepID=UPI0025E05C98|nr:hypothetical protein [Sphingomonas sp.]MBV9527048.1 hypothetical protein [Sphingomonas sp.]
MKRPAVCWLFDGLGIASWIAAVLAYVSAKHLMDLSGNALQAGVFPSWAAVYGERAAVEYVAPVVGTLFLGFSAIVGQLARSRPTSGS